MEQQTVDTLPTPPTVEETPKVGVGESTQEQLSPQSTVAKLRMELLINNNEIVIEDCRKIQALLLADPTLDGSLCRLFGIRVSDQITKYSK